MKLVVGLGNPGASYAATRHNVGFRVAAELARRWGIALVQDRYEGRFGCGRPRGMAEEIGVLLPQTFMNASGRSVRAALEALRLDAARDLLVVVDDLDLPFARLRLRAAGGSGGHRGLLSIASELGTREFPRLRFGIGRPASTEDPVRHVLAGFGADEERALPRAVESAADAVEQVFSEGLDAAMDRYNRAPLQAPGAEEEGDHDS